MMAPLVGQIDAGFQPIHVAMAVLGIAHQHHAFQTPASQHQLAIDPHCRVFIAHRFGLASAFLILARGEHVAAHHLQFRRLDRPVIRGAAIASDGCREYLALFEQRRYQAIYGLVVLDALADREDVGM